MSLKAKLTTTLAALCMVICLLVVGVMAATSGTVNLGGTVSFVATDVQVKIATAVDGGGAGDHGTVSGTAIADGDTVIANWDYTTEEGKATAEFKPEVSFETKTGTITLVIKVQNLNGERAVKATFAPTLGGEDIPALAEGQTFTDATELGDTNVIAAVTSTATSIADGATQYFTIQLKIANPNEQVNAALAGSLTLSN